MRLTKTYIEKAKYEGAGNRDIRWESDLPGFGLRIYPSGVKAFVLEYRMHGRQQLITLGRFGVLTLDQAKREARVKLGEISSGINPAAERREKVKSATVGDLCEAYLTRYSKPHRKSHKIDEGRMRLHILPALKGVPLRALTVADLERLHLRIGETREVEANRVIELMRTMLDKAKSWGLLPDEAINVAKSVKRFKERSRDRWLTPEEVPCVARAIASEPNSYVRGIIWMYLLTGCRKSELLGAKWEHVDLVRAELRLPETKNGSAFYVSLSTAALDILRGLPREPGNPYIFCGHRTGKHLVNIAKPWNRIRATAGVEDVTLHDLRRTVGSWLAQQGMSLHLIGRVLNHSSSEATKVYARFATDSTRVALEQHGLQLVRVAGASQ